MGEYARLVQGKLEKVLIYLLINYALVDRVLILLSLVSLLLVGSHIYERIKVIAIDANMWRSIKFKIKTGINIYAG